MNNYPGFAARPPLPVVPYQSSTVHIVVVGIGGTGSWLAMHLARLVWDFNRTWEQVRDEKPRRASLTLVDHDSVEEGNIRARQNFCPAEIGYPKAQLLANRAAFAFGLTESEISAYVGPFSSSLLSQRWDSLTIIVGCVDNAKARQEIALCLVHSNVYRARQEEHAPLIWWIDSGNSRHAGQVLCGNVTRVTELRGALTGPLCLRLPSPSLVHPELLIPRPDEETTTSAHLSCKDLVLVGEPAIQQSRTINNHMAALVYGYVEMLIYGGLTTFATYTDNSTFTTRSLETTPERLGHALGLQPSFFTTREASAQEEDCSDEDEE
jgi:hypothetical protein